MRTSPLVAWLPVLCLAGCDGVISDPSAGGGRGSTVSPSDPAYCAKVDPDPGPVTLRRLNREEYNNTVRDLLGVATRPADAFPEDDISGGGFDNDGDTLSLGDLHLEKYDAAARELAAEALAAGSPVRGRYLTCDPAADEGGCARTFLGAFGLRAWRRPLAADEVDRLARLFEGARAEGEGFDGALRLAIRALLLSPHFLFHVERDGGAEARPLDGYELASRLSYFLWTTMPDDTLLERAAEGALSRREELALEVDRMLAHPKSAGFYESFVGQWLDLRDLAHAAPDGSRFPEWDDALRESMRRETVELVRYIVDSNSPVGDLLSAKYTFVDARLADHYGIDGVTGGEMRRVDLGGTERGGILTHGSILTVTSHPDVTSPVKRGKWVLEQILCAPPPDPPPDVDTFIGGSETGESLRERLERHRADPACATCHSVMDPIGFGLESYDPIGRHRTEYDGHAVDASGELPDGTTFEGAQGLQQALGEDDRFVQCVTKKMMAYALGRGVRSADRCFVEEIIEQAQRQDLSLREMIVRIVTNDVFTTIGGREEGR